MFLSMDRSRIRAEVLLWLLSSLSLSSMRLCEAKARSGSRVGVFIATETKAIFETEQVRDILRDVWVQLLPEFFFTEYYCVWGRLLPGDVCDKLHVTSLSRMC